MSYIIGLFVTSKYLKGFCALWAGWIYFSSSVVITRFQFADAFSKVTGLRHAVAMRIWEGAWWITDRAYHVIVFGILSLALLNAFTYFKKRPLLICPLVFLFAALDEYHQSVVNFPAAHFYDVFIDSIGILVALWIFIRVQIKQDSLAASTL